MRKLLSLTLLLIPLLLSANNDSKEKKDDNGLKSYETQWIQGEAPQIDGLLNDPAWEQVEWGGDFTQQQPNDGEAPSQRTAFKILYDAKNLYVGVRAYDDEPEKIVRRMSRRDGFDGDWVEINIDSYFDKLTAFSFTASVSGVKGDEYVSNNGNNWDSSWDPIWYLKTSIDEEGWIAEFRIPLSQLRFADKPEHTWGIQVTRRYFRNEERSLWQHIPQDAAGWVHHFGHLVGLKGIKPQKQIEIQPYIVGKTERFEREEGNPFLTGKESDVTVGVDGKIGITSDITLDFTINPDFGQVEADPSQVNLGAFQVFFREQRPFFVEGNNILNFRVSQSIAGGPFNRDNLFYSRRIGRRPSAFPSLNDNEYADVPNNTRILGSAKLTGKNANGLSWGLQNSITAREQATIDNEGSRRKETVEPLTSYSVARIQQDLNGGNTVFGAMFTSTNRNIEDSQLEFLHRDAYSGGIDFLHNWKDRTYYVSFRGIYTHISGTEEAITGTQQSFQHLFQRPDADHVSVDTTRTSLQGTGGEYRFGKNSGSLIFQTGGTWRSPGVEFNDLGFMRTADQINQWTWAQYRWLDPFSIFRWIRVNGNQYLQWDFGGVNTYQAVNINAHTQFENFWRMGTGVTYEPREISNADLRGGPAIRYPGGINQWMWFGTDNRKKIRFSMEHWNNWGREGYRRGKGYWMNITYRPFDALRVSLSPSVNFNDDRMQYVTTVQNGNEDRYITGYINQNTYSMSLRMSYVITPDLTVQFWGQPFMSRGKYTNFRRITDPGANEYVDRFHQFTNQEITYDSSIDEYIVDENLDGNADYNIYNPDFNFVQYRGNFVIRWEYIPGSTLFLVWTRDQTAGLDLERGSFNELTNGLLDVKPHDIFLIKYTYRFRL